MHIYLMYICLYEINELIIRHVPVYLCYHLTKLPQNLNNLLYNIIGLFMVNIVKVILTCLVMSHIVLPRFPYPVYIYIYLPSLAVKLDRSPNSLRVCIVTRLSPPCRAMTTVYMYAIDRLNATE